MLDILGVYIFVIYIYMYLGMLHDSNGSAAARIWIRRVTECGMGWL